MIPILPAVSPPTFPTAELVAAALSAGMLLGYQVWLAYRARRDPLYTIQAYHRHARTRWVEHIMADPDKNGILGVQTLRNSTMGATFMASTIMLLLLGVISLAGNPDAIGKLSPALDAWIPAHPDVWNVKVFALVVDLFVAFFAFVMSVRLYTHVGYQLALVPDHLPHGVSVQRVAGMLNRSGRLFSLGLRACYLGMPLTFWLFGPAYLVAASAALVVVMRLLDRNRVDGD